MVRKWYGFFRDALQATYYKACRISSSNPSWGRRRSGGRVGRFVGAWGDLSQRDEWGAVYQGWGVGKQFVPFTISNGGVAVCEICPGSVGDHRAPDRGLDKTS